jgi:hypothetical protein
LSYHKLTRVRSKGVFLDLRSQGFNVGAAGLVAHGGVLSLVFSSSVQGGPTYDDKLGMRSFEVTSVDEGKTWTTPADTTPDHLLRTTGGSGETLSVNRNLVTARGTHVHTGLHHVEGQNRVIDGHKVRAYTAIIGRQESGNGEIDYTSIESGTFLAEQFIENGIALGSGRILLCLWGAGRPGENWQSGVLISDDDGRTWRYKQVAYASDLSLRDDPATPTGFNEHTHILMPDGRIVVMLRAEGVGRVVAEAPQDTCYFRSETTDEGDTWTAPEPANLFGTGASFNGVAFSDGSILMTSRIPFSRDLHDLPDGSLFGQHYARSQDGGKTWNTEHIVQSDIEGSNFESHYSAGRGSFLLSSRGTIMHAYGFRDENKKLFRMLYTELELQNSQIRVASCV